MINLYIGKDSLPKDKHFVFDSSSVIGAVDCCGTDFQKLVLKEIEKGTYYNKVQFVDRFGVNLYYDCMSMGSKILFGLEGLPDTIINCDECGYNAIKLISLIDNCNCYFSIRNMGIPYVRDCPIMYNGTLYKHISDLNYDLR